MSMEVDGILVAAHELKAPLAVLRQLALSLDGLNLQNEQVESELSQIRSEMVQVSERAIKQVNDLAKIRRLEDGLFKMEPVAVREVCDAVSREIAHLYVKEGREFRTEYHNRERLVTANRELLFSVVYNFATNALHYAERGSRAVLKIGEKKGKMRVLVRDYGPSLPTSIWREMQGGLVAQPTAIAMRPGSSGLGLYIASKFSQYMEAQIGAVRHRDGTSFFVELPISKQASLF